VETERAELERERVALVVERFRMADELRRAAEADLYDRSCVASPSPNL
jgi:hypothetical protein